MNNTLLNQFLDIKGAFEAEPYPSKQKRIEQLKQIRNILKQNAADLVEALNHDFSYRSAEETLFLEIFPAINAIDYCIKHLKKWMKPEKRKTRWYLKTSSAMVFAQPLGVIGIMTPWNYPIYLSIVPIAYALAAGNRVMVKLSDTTPDTATTLKTLLAPVSAISLVEGGIETAKEFSALPFSHLLFTGSPQTGQKIMAAASAHLTPVTLELGGKSPAVLSRSMHVQYFSRLFMGKLYNAGQTCIAPDYLLIPPEMSEQIEKQFSIFLNRYYPDLMNNTAYSCLISDKHYEYIESLLEDARVKGGRIVSFGEKKPGSRRFPFCLIFNVRDDMRLMQEEIFGPLLPVMIYRSFQEAVDFIRSRPNPLALYYFGENSHEIETLQHQTLSGALTLNDTIMHIAVDDLPFGGVGQSGMGHYHGREGFNCFSKLKPVFSQGRVSLVSWFYPPYGKMLKYFLRYFARIRF